MGDKKYMTPEEFYETVQRLAEESVGKKESDRCAYNDLLIIRAINIAAEIDIDRTLNERRKPHAINWSNERAMKHILKHYCNIACGIRE